MEGDEGRHGEDAAVFTRPYHRSDATADLDFALCHANRLELK
jgi:hypothetical protein